MPMQFIQDNSGLVTAVIIPIEEWRNITSKHQDLKQLEQRQNPEPVKEIQPSDFAGTLSDEGYQAINEHIQQIRNDWDRHTF